MILRADTLACLAALPLALSVNSCSSPASTGSGDWGNGTNTGSGAPAPSATGTGSGNANGNNPNGSSGSSHAASSSGGQQASGSGGIAASSGSSSGAKQTSSSGGMASSSSSSSSGGNSSSGSGSGSGGATGALGRQTGCGQATTCTPGTDLAPPANGVQFALPDGSVTVQPGQEAYYCYWNTLQQATVVGAFQSWMSPGSSHHFITFEETAAHADGSIATCSFGSGNWRYATSVAGQVIELKFPDTVGLQIAAGQQIDMNMHFVNPGSSAANPIVKLNIVYAQNVQNYASAMISFNASINVPAASAVGPGTQTVNGTCTAPGGSNFFAITTHTHKWATQAQVNLVRGGQTTNIVNTTNWEAPDVALWNGPTWLTMGPGDSFTYSCSYSNSGPTPITVGETAANNEMCMAIGYYFPVGSTMCF